MTITHVPSHTHTQNRYTCVVGKYLNANQHVVSDKVDQAVNAGVQASGITKLAGMTFKNGTLQFNVKDFFNETVCIPLRDYVLKQIDTGLGNMTDRLQSINHDEGAGDSNHSGRRLLEHWSHSE